MDYQAVCRNESDLVDAVVWAKKMLVSHPEVHVVVQPWQRKRSQLQNRRYWAVLRNIEEQIELDGQAYSVETWHRYFRGKYIGVSEIPMPGGDVQVEPLSTTKLTVAEFGDYMTAIEAWAAENGVVFDELPGVH